MADPAPLTDRQTDRLITALKHGQDVDAAAAELDMDLRRVWVRARTDTRLAIALAGRDPDVVDERGRAHRAEYLRLLALGLPPARAELILGLTSVGGWRGDDPAFAAACDAVSAASAQYSDVRMVRLTPPRIARFLAELRVPDSTVIGAAAAVGVSPAAIYQKRRRDKKFAQAMDAARQPAESTAK